VGRAIGLTQNALAVRYSGLDALVRARKRVVVPYISIRFVGVGFADVPATFAFRVGLTTAPLGTTRRGTFWWNGKRMFLDFADPARAVVLQLANERDDLIAIEPDTSPADLAAVLHDRAGVAR
jgi:hypothetical protein